MHEDPYTYSQPAQPKNPHPLVVLIATWLFLFTAVLAALWVWF